MKKQSRREFIKVVGLSGGGLVLSAFVPAQNIFLMPGEEPKIFSPSVYLRIDEKGIVTVMVHRTEMGQGVRTSLPMLVAEELEVDWKNIRVEQADADKKYGDQSTGGSWSIRRTYEPFRVAGATARVMLITAAAAKWGVDVSQCYAENGFVINKVNSKKLSYGELVEDAAKLPVPQDVKLKSPDEYKLIGKNTKRLDSPDKLYGKAKFGFDIFIPGMLYTVIARSPFIGGAVKSFDDSETKKIKGVKKVVQISNGIAVLADSTWAALKGRDALKIDWDKGPNANLSSESIRKEMESYLNKEGMEIEVVGSIPQNIPDEKIIEAVYDVPYIAHAPMEPVNAVASFKNGKAELWVSSQNPQGAQYEVARKLNLKQEDVTIHVTLAGGGFGRKLRSDYAVEAAEIAGVTGEIVKLIWTRSDDMKHGYFRPVSMHKLKGSVSNGKVVKMEHHIIAQSIRAQDYNALPKNPKEVDTTSYATKLKYAIPYKKVTATALKFPVLVSWLRAVFGTQNPFAVESFIDELAHAAGKDPFQFRKEMLPDDSRLKNVLIEAAEKSGWGQKLGNGKGRGIALSEAYDSYCAQVAEVTVVNNVLKIDRFVAAVDCGVVINPDSVTAQIEGGIAFALSAALKGEITINNGQVVQSNYDDYPILTLDEMPKVEVHISKNNHKVGGIGELAILACAPALANAIFAATGKRIRKLPLDLS